MKSKRGITILGLTGGLLLIIILLFRINLFRTSQNITLQKLTSIFAGKQLQVTCEAGILKDRVTIKLANTGKIVYQKGQFKNNVGDIYGGPMFDVYYRGILTGRALLDYTAPWYTNRFSFHFFEKEGQVRFTFSTGKSGSSGEEGYLWIDKINDSFYYKLYRADGRLLRKWQE